MSQPIGAEGHAAGVADRGTVDDQGARPDGAGAQDGLGAVAVAVAVGIGEHDPARGPARAAGAGVGVGAGAHDYPGVAADRFAARDLQGGDQFVGVAGDAVAHDQATEARHRESHQDGEDGDGDQQFDQGEAAGVAARSGDRCGLALACGRRQGGIPLLMRGTLV